MSVVQRSLRSQKLGVSNVSFVHTLKYQSLKRQALILVQLRCSVSYFHFFLNNKQNTGIAQTVPTAKLYVTNYTQWCQLSVRHQSRTDIGCSSEVLATIHEIFARHVLSIVVSLPQKCGRRGGVALSLAPATTIATTFLALFSTLLLHMCQYM